MYPNVVADAPFKMAGISAFAMAVNNSSKKFTLSSGSAPAPAWPSAVFVDAILYGKELVAVAAVD